MPSHHNKKPPLLTLAALAHARARWNTAKITSYDAQYVINGTDHRITVRDGQTDSLLIDGRPATSADPDVFSIPGIFDTLEADLDLLEMPSSPFGINATYRMLRVRFNTHLGYVERYVRPTAGGARSATVILRTFTPTPSAPGEPDRL